MEQPNAPLQFEKAAAPTYLVCSPQLNENSSEVASALRDRALTEGYRGHFELLDRAPKPSTVNENSIILTDLPIRIGKSTQDILALVIPYLMKGCEVHIFDHLHIQPNTDAAKCFVGFDVVRRSLKGSRIKQGLWLAKQSGRAIGRRRADTSVSTFAAAKKECGSYRSAATKLRSLGHDISKSTLHALLRPAGGSSE